MIRILFLLCFLLTFSLESAESIILKFQSNSPEFQQWKSNARSGVIPALEAVIGMHDSKPYLRDALIAMLRKTKNEQMLAMQVHPLERIAIITVLTDIPSKKALSGLNALSFVEYAELAPKHVLINRPNDPLYAYQYYCGMIGLDSAMEIYESAQKKDSVIIGIVDTGVDPLHEDIAGAMFVNPGESGIDSIGNSKSANGIDDDNNGFIDDWQGWDFASSTDQVKGDNRAVPGHLHGTHVAGIACAITNNEKGIVGIARNHKILPVKVGFDDSNSVTVSGSYEGMVYASLMGADIINCSWGSPTASMAEQEIINEVLQQGSVIIGGAGNDQSPIAFYPASYRGVISVAALGADTVKANYSNYHETVDISAPGSFIYSTVLGNTYGYSSGTSMAAPVVTGIAGLIKSLRPEYSAGQIAGIMKASALDVSELNKEYMTSLGAGMVHAARALSISNPRYAEIVQSQFVETNPDGMYTPGERVDLSIVIHNILEDADSCMVIIHSDDKQYPVGIINDTLNIGMLKATTVYAIGESIKCILPNISPFNHRIVLRLDIMSGAKRIGSGFAELIINPTYRTMRSNDMHVTVTSQGHIGYNDYPSNQQGIGVMLPPYQQSLLFESGFIVGTSAKQLSNGVRDISGDEQEKSFYITSSVGIASPGEKTTSQSLARFADSVRAIDAGVSVKHQVFQSDDADLSSMIFMTYDIKNERNERVDSMYAGMFYDWDIGPSGQNNICAFDHNDGYAQCFSTVDSTLPYIGVTLLNALPVQFHAIDNDGRGGGFSVYDGFSRNEKWYAISGGVSRDISRSTDASMVFGGGPFALDPGKEQQLAIAIVSGKTKEEIRSNIIKARKRASEKGISSGFAWKILPEKSRLIDISIAQNEMIRIDFELSEQQEVYFEIYSMQGELLRASESKTMDAGEYAGTFMSCRGLPSGVYFVKMRTLFSHDALPFIITR